MLVGDEERLMAELIARLQAMPQGSFPYMGQRGFVGVVKEGNIYADRAAIVLMER